MQADIEHRDSLPRAGLAEHLVLALAEPTWRELLALLDGETETTEDFALDRRTGRPVISSAESLRLILSCFQNQNMVCRDDLIS